MTVGTREQETIFRRLVVLAGGDRDLVWTAIRHCADAEGMAAFDSVIKEINKLLREKVQQARAENAREYAAI
jgi:hypothetical protein